jgi:hypothetical protein
MQPQAPADLRAQLIALVAASNPDYTANLPGSLIEDISSTDVYALVESDSFLVDLVNSVTPFGANAFLLNQLGVLYGIDKQPVTNTAVYVVFTGTPGYVIAQGFTVGDGTYQYVCQSGGVCGMDGQTLALYALATRPGAWSVPPSTVVEMITSVPSGVALSVTNPVAGVPSTMGEPISVWRERCWTAGLAASTGMARYLKTLLGNVPGVQQRLVAVRQNPDATYTVICGGGDPYQVAYAIWQADFYTPGLSGAVIEVAGISNADPMVVTTAGNHNLVTGDIEILSGVVGMPYVNDQPYAVTVINPKQFSIPVDGTPMGKYQYGGTVTPNPINEYVTITDPPDTYLIPFAIPPQETVVIVATWQTDSPNYVSDAAMAQAAAPALVGYINSLQAGITPINFNVMNSVFLNAVSTILPAESIIDLTFTVSVNGVGALPQAGTQVIYGDPYSYFYTDLASVSVVRAG